MAIDASSPPLIVDGYNVIFRLVPAALTEPDEMRRCREGLEDDLDRLARDQSARVWVFYDGRRVQGVLPAAGTRASVQVTYVEPPAEADDAIVQKATQLVRDGTRRVTVVTSDRELARRVRQAGGSVETVEAFRLRLVRHPTEPGSPPRGGDAEAKLLAIHEALERIAAHAAGQEHAVPAATSQEAADSTTEKNGAIAVDAVEARRQRGRRRQARRLHQQNAGKSRNKGRKGGRR